MTFFRLLQKYRQVLKIVILSEAKNPCSNKIKKIDSSLRFRMTFKIELLELLNILKRTFAVCCIFIFIFLITASDVFTQTNTEKYLDFKPDGFYHAMNFAFNLKRGNEEYAKYNADYRLDMYSQKFISYLAGNIEYQKGNRNVISNKGFVHYRFIYNRDKYLEPEAFTQLEYNDFILLRERFLIGGGLRLNQINYLSDDSINKIIIAFGIGLMYEYENVRDSIKPETKYIRSTNFASIRINYLKNLNFFSVSYFQPHLGNVSDFRILSENRLSFSINKHLAFFVSAVYRYDNEPHTNLKYYDLEILNGVTITF